MSDRICFQDNYCAVVYKYAGEDSQTFFIPLFPHAAFTQAVNRLDKPVSGLVLIAFSSVVQTAFTHAFIQDKVQKEYWAICERPKNDYCLPEIREEQPPIQQKLEQLVFFNKKRQKAFIVTPEIYASNSAKKTMKVKPAFLYWTLCGRGSNYDFMQLLPRTGRTHQIRVQMASIGRPIKGDIKYGAKRSEKDGGIRLHGYKLEFTHPITHKNIVVCAEPYNADTLWTACKESCLAYTSGSGVLA